MYITIYQSILFTHLYIYLPDNTPKLLSIYLFTYLCIYFPHYSFRYTLQSASQSSCRRVSQGRVGVITSTVRDCLLMAVIYFPALFSPSQAFLSNNQPPGGGLCYDWRRAPPLDQLGRSEPKVVFKVFEPPTRCCSGRVPKPLCHMAVTEGGCR